MAHFKKYVTSQVFPPKNKQAVLALPLVRQCP